MQIYLPIAEMSVHILLILSLGGAVGFLSGMFGVGGGFIMTPLLIFSGIPAPVAVGSEMLHIVASSASGALAHWRRGTLDLKMALLLLAGGAAGSGGGIVLFRWLTAAGQIDLFIALSYVLLLGTIGGLMLNEALRVLAAQRRGAVARRRPGQHHWLHGLPLKMRFRTSRLYISAIPPFVLGVAVGVLGAILGVGGGFIMVPAMIYLLRMPTNVVIGTSLFQIVFVAAFTTILHATVNATVDVVLAALLIVGGVIGVQVGVRAGAKLRGEQLRALLGLLTVAVALRMLWELVATPADPYSLAARAF